MQIHDTKETFVLVLQRNPVAQRAQIVSEMHVACWLRTTKNSFRHELENVSVIGSALYTKQEQVINPLQDRTDDGSKKSQVDQENE